MTAREEDSRRVEDVYGSDCGVSRQYVRPSRYRPWSILANLQPPLPASRVMGPPREQWHSDTTASNNDVPVKQPRRRPESSTNYLKEMRTWRYFRKMIDVG